MLEGLVQLEFNNAFSISQDMHRANRGFREGNDVPAMFGNDCCEVGEEYKVRGSALYEAYKNWALANGYKPIASRRMKDQWERLGFTRSSEKTANFDVGVKLRHAAYTDPGAW